MPPGRGAPPSRFPATTRMNLCIRSRSRVGRRPLYLAGASRPGPTNRDNRAAHALARIMLHGRIDNIQTSWVKLGTAGTRVMLRSGANDLGGTLMEETISRMAGSQYGSAKTVAELAENAERNDRPVRERTTTYGEPPSRGPVAVASWSELSRER